MPRGKKCSKPLPRRPVESVRKREEDVSRFVNEKFFSRDPKETRQGEMSYLMCHGTLLPSQAPSKRRKEVETRVLQGELVSPSAEQRAKPASQVPRHVLGHRCQRKSGLAVQPA